VSTHKNYIFDVLIIEYFHAKLVIKGFKDNPIYSKKKMIYVTL